MLYEQLESLCKERGISVSKLLEEIEVTKSSASRWKTKGYKPSPPTKKKIADYLGLSVTDLENTLNKKPATQKGDELKPDEIELLNNFKHLTPENKAIAIAHAEWLLEKQQ